MKRAYHACRLSIPALKVPSGSCVSLCNKASTNVCMPTAATALLHGVCTTSSSSFIRVFESCDYLLDLPRPILKQSFFFCDMVSLLLHIFKCDAQGLVSVLDLVELSFSHTAGLAEPGAPDPFAACLHRRAAAPVLDVLRFPVFCRNLAKGNSFMSAMPISLSASGFFFSNACRSSSCVVCIGLVSSHWFTASLLSVCKIEA